MTPRVLTCFTLAVAFGAAVLGVISPAAAKPTHRSSLAEYYGAFLPERLNHCGACHVKPAGSPLAKLADFPHNPFGDRVRQVRERLRAEGRRNDISLVLSLVADEDADGDGSPNEVELLTGHRPGDPQDRPSKTELAALPALRKRFQAYLAAYHWRPFEPVRQPAVPRVKRAAWVRNPIDAFIAAEHEKRGLTPRPEAPKAVLLRRVTLDLTGLAPTPEELHDFLADRSPGAYERVVDRLLASPRYGERWGRHWMDVWRYSDWTGYGEQVRDSKPHIWRWRDWIVGSLNRDKPYDRMLQEMLAGDELAPGDPEALAGTGFLVRNFKLLSREQWMQDVVDHTGQGFMGLTVGCARCHDHMYDPITQQEYYRLRAVFEPHEIRTDWVPGQIDTAKDGLPRAFDARLDAPTFFYPRGDERQAVKDQPLAPGTPQCFGPLPEIRPVPLPLLAREPARQPFVIEAQRAAAREKVAAAAKGPRPELSRRAAECALAALEAVLKAESLEDAGQRETPAWKEAAAGAVQAQREQAAADAALARTEAADAVDKLGPNAKVEATKTARDKLAASEASLRKAEADLLAPPSVAYQPRFAPYPAASSGRRLALARWLTGPEHPLTARVAVNHIWLRHFGEAIVPTVENFGRNGQPPTHPALLDWLASGFASGRWEAGTSVITGTPWSMKRLHRLIVTSATYRMASTPDSVDARKDPDNRFLWRMNSRRLEAEAVRDNILWVAGQLDPAMGGPDIDQNLGLTVKRRSIYFRHAPEKEMEFLALFDMANPTECYRRRPSVMPQQALALANSEIALVQARLLARQLAGEPDFVLAAFERVLSRPPSPAERGECARFLADQARRLGALPATAPTPDVKDPGKPAADPALRARENLVLVLLNHNDFVTLR